MKNMRNINRALLALAAICAFALSDAQTYTFDGRTKDAVKVEAKDVYSADKGYGYDFQDIVAEARTMQNGT